MIRPLLIDFAPASITRGIARTSASAWLALAASTTLCLAAAISLHGLSERIAILQSEIAVAEKLARQAQARRAPAQPLDIPDAQARAVNRAVAQLNLPWGDVFDAVEAATTSSVALLSLEPDARKRFVKGVAESRTSEGMIAYVENLKRQAFFSTVILTRHEINEQDLNRPIRFHFEAQWVQKPL